MIHSQSRRWWSQRNKQAVCIAFGISALLIIGLFVTTNRRLQRDLNRANDPCWSAVNRVKRANVQLVAFDFDATIIDIHTGGRWKGTAAELSKHVRPSFHCFVKYCLEGGIHVSVATFSTQTELIAAVLTHSIDHTDANAIPVFGDDDRSEGKQSQLLLSMNHFNQIRSQRSNPITPANTLLVDDDSDNIQAAKADGYNTMHFRPGSSIFTLNMARAAEPAQRKGTA